MEKWTSSLWNMRSLWIVVLVFRCMSGNSLDIRMGDDKVKRCARMMPAWADLSVFTCAISSFAYGTLISFYVPDNHPLRKVLKAFWEAVGRISNLSLYTWKRLWTRELICWWITLESLLVGKMLSLILDRVNLWSRMRKCAKLRWQRGANWIFLRPTSIISRQKSNRSLLGW